MPLEMIRYTSFFVFCHIVVSLNLISAATSTPHFDGTCMMEKELAREIGRGEFCQAISPRRPGKTAVVAETVARSSRQQLSGERSAHESGFG
ncbi:hypothetical protein Q5P01_019186 [Channa striata]|uniref:Secreted protein n=1 Tax=Channa striata TaxID=64152 RepID=A0AA88M2E3_CHASR|nr:hypothetical protein Q5P01_019186 [Channa striata]